MSSDRDLLAEAVERLLSGSAVPDWAAIDEIGIGSLLLPESDGGIDGTHEDLSAVLRVCGRHGLEQPVGETNISRALLARAGLDVAPGPCVFGIAEAVTLTPSSSGSGINLTGTLKSVPAGVSLDTVVTVVAQQERGIVVSLAMNSARSRTTGAKLEFLNAPVRAFGTLDRRADLLELGAALRVSQMAGAIEGVLRLTIEHANGRSQFGRKLSEFQVIQHHLAVLAEESAAATSAATSMSRALDLGDASFEVAAAKLRTNRAAGVATGLAHQIHGAIGCTQEHALHRLTRKLWSWRSEYGNDRYWALELGNSIARAGADCFWSALTERGDRR